MSGEATAYLESPRGVAWHNGAHEGTSPPSGKPGGACQGAVPSDYAYDADEGYAGMLLYQLSPRLGEAAYPVIATQTAERYMAAVLFLGIIISLPPLIIYTLPRRMAYVSFIVLIPALHRLALVHTRRFSLLFRQFEPWYLIASLTVFFVSIITSDAYLHGKIYALNMCAAGWSALALDCIRMPYKIVLYTATAYLVLTAFWTSYFLLTGVATGRMATLALFFAKYTVNLLVRPGAYVVLRRPLFVRDARTIIDSSCSSVNPAAASLLRRLSTRPSSQMTARILPLPGPIEEATPSTAAHVSNPLFPPAHPHEAAIPPTAPATQTLPTSSPPAPPSLILPTSLEAPSSPPHSLPRRLPPLPSPHPSSPTHPSSAPASNNPPAPLPSDGLNAPHAACAPPASPPSPSPAASIIQEDPLPLPPPNTVEAPPLLLYHHLRLPTSFIYLLSHPMVHRVEPYVWLAASALCTAPLFLPAPVPPWLLHLSWLWPLLMLRRLLFIYPELLVIQLLQFETWLLLGNVGFGLMMIEWRLFTTLPARAWAVNLLLSTLPIVFMDSLHLQANVKRRIAATHSLFMLFVCAVKTWLPSHYMDPKAMLAAYTSAGSFFMGRLFTLAIFFLKYAVNLWLRPDIFLVLCAPLMRNERLGMLVRTLREL